MARAQAGDAQAYAALLAAVLPLLRTIARRRGCSPADAEDAVQDTLLTVHQVRHTYDPARPFRPWLRAIVEHRITDRLRRTARSRRETPLDAIAETIAAPAANLSLHDVALLARAVLTLPPGQRRAVEMLKLREMTLKEAAAMTGMTIPALKVAVHRGLATLRLRMVGKT